MRTKRSSGSLERRLEADTHIISSNERADKHDGLRKPRELEGQINLMDYIRGNIIINQYRALTF